MSGFRLIARANVCGGNATLETLDRRLGYGGKKGRAAARRLRLLERASAIPAYAVRAAIRAMSHSEAVEVAKRLLQHHAELAAQTEPN